MSGIDGNGDESDHGLVCISSSKEIIEKVDLSEFFPRDYGYTFSDVTKKRESKSALVRSFIFSFAFATLLTIVTTLVVMIVSAEDFRIVFIPIMFIMSFSTLLLCGYLLNLLRSSVVVVARYDFPYNLKSICYDLSSNEFYYSHISDMGIETCVRRFEPSDVVAWGKIEEFELVTYIVVAKLEAYSCPPSSIYHRPHNRFVIPFCEENKEFERAMNLLMKPSYVLSRKNS